MKELSVEESYVIRILDSMQDCWVADIQGDPGRTLFKGNAKHFDHLPVKEIARLAKKYPRRVFSGELVAADTAKEK